MAGTCSTNGEKTKPNLQKPKRRAAVEMRDWSVIIADGKRLFVRHEHMCKCDVKGAVCEDMVWTECVWFRIRNCGGLL